MKRAAPSAGESGLRIRVTRWAISFAARLADLTGRSTRVVYRSMKKTDVDELPALGDGSRELGAKAGVHVLVDGKGFVAPGGGGLSVVPHTPSNISPARLPPELGGSWKDPLWSFDLRFLDPRLKYRPDLDDPTHGLIEPSVPMPYHEYEMALAATRQHWALYIDDDSTH